LNREPSIRTRSHQSRDTIARLGDLLFAGLVERDQEKKAREEVQQPAAAESDRTYSDLEVSRIAELRKAALCAIGRTDCPPYYAILAADGDRMGLLLNAMTTAEEHRHVSTALSEFARQAASAIRDHEGHPIYTGGDDVLVVREDASRDPALRKAYAEIGAALAPAPPAAPRPAPQPGRVNAGR